MEIKNQKGYGHAGMTINLSLADEIVIAQQICHLDEAESFLESLHGFVDPIFLEELDHAVGCIHRTKWFLKKLTTIDLTKSYNDLFEDAEESAGGTTAAGE